MFAHGSAETQGGTLFAQRSAETQGGTLFAQRSAETQGGTLFAQRSAETQGGTLFAERSAETQGGTLFAQFAAETLTASDFRADGSLQRPGCYLVLFTNDTETSKVFTQVASAMPKPRFAIIDPSRLPSSGMERISHFLDGKHVGDYQGIVSKEALTNYALNKAS